MHYFRTLCAALVLFASPIDAANYTHSQLSEQAETFLANQLGHLDGDIQLTASSLDARMPARQCQQPLQFSLAGSQTPDRQATVQIECSDAEAPWRLFVPVRIQRMQNVVVAAHNLPAGHVISASDLSVNKVDVQQVRDSVFSQPDALIGARIKRRVGALQAIQARHTCFVCRGENITIITKVGNLHIQATGIARSDGLLGERIVVTNARSNKDVQGVISAIGEVTVSQ
ncbi:flagella basal body P-ring formation protein FlgA [Aliidiomarina taiwanensis]|uniref:Flagella basal body P-ring formation protein FlgA n=1 Tax=Aliidiomarina taiwanensis TaxID=946228 RepID=A0A432X812_9GAMM|nr:flagellar basal body P-ring formation chaperone FlgA [Aliidiomarina taiwanensis]RUO43009.1 flagella basal body P-ring formation protein FlgA [Aliidiomarina taiwanensis]